MHRDVEVAKRLKSALHHGLSLVSVGDVRVHREGASSVAFHLRGSLLGACPVDVGKNTMGPCLSQTPGSGQANPPRCAGHHGHLIRKLPRMLLGARCQPPRLCTALRMILSWQLTPYAGR